MTGFVVGFEKEMIASLNRNKMLDPFIWKQIIYSFVCMLPQYKVKILACKIYYLQIYAIHYYKCYVTSN